MSKSQETILSKNSFVLKTVNPFDYIKGRNRLERPADIVASFKEKLRLDETLEEQKLEKLFACKTAKDFETVFFESFHPVKDAKNFISEPFSQQKSSSRLMSPVVCAKVLEWSLKPENVFVESVILALISSGHMSLYTNSGTLIDKIIELKSASLILALLHGFTDLSDSGLTKLLLFLVEEADECDKIFKDFDSTDFKFNEIISVADSCFLALLAMPKSIQLTKKYFVIVKESTIIDILNQLLKVFKAISIEKSIKFSSKCLFKAPNCNQILEWISVIIDSQYPLCLIQPNLLKIIDEINRIISEEVSLNDDLMNILPAIKEARTTKSLSDKEIKARDAIVISSSYRIEPSTI